MRRAFRVLGIALVTATVLTVGGYVGLGAFWTPVINDAVIAAASTEFAGTVEYAGFDREGGWAEVYLTDDLVDQPQARCEALLAAIRERIPLAPPFAVEIFGPRPIGASTEALNASCGSVSALWFD